MYIRQGRTGSPTRETTIGAADSRCAAVRATYCLAAAAAGARLGTFVGLPGFR